MKKIIASISCATLLIFSSCCHKEIPTKLTGYFYTTDISITEEVIKLYIDGQEKGILPFINRSFTSIDALDSSMKANALKIEFMSGKHLVQSKKSDGSIVSSSEMYFEFYKNKTESGVVSDIGASGSKYFNDPKQVLIWLAANPK
ncbi:MAG: hypothetical protein QM530_07890 [Phycisphaerales bacterium]|nr:hypothetical protein [Phycisphaerales bacterium]